jgi:hypothetical protein
MEPDECLMACRLGLIGVDTPLEENPISIVKMTGDKIHPDMDPRLPFHEQIDLIEKYPFLRNRLIYPTIDLPLIMSDDWEILE